MPETPFEFITRGGEKFLADLRKVEVTRTAGGTQCKLTFMQRTSRKTNTVETFVPKEQPLQEHLQKTLSTYLTDEVPLPF